MKFFSFALLAVAATVVPSVKADTAAPPEGTEIVTNADGFSGYCSNASGAELDHSYSNRSTPSQCDSRCKQVGTSGLLGFAVWAEEHLCYCFYESGTNSNVDFSSNPAVEGPIEDVLTDGDYAYYSCYKYTTGDSENTDEDLDKDSDKDAEATGDPHFRTFKDEHFEFHGQCDVVMTSVKNFADQGVDLDIHLRTNMVRYWSYIKSAAIRIGNDILEVEGSAAMEDGKDKRHYHINYEYRGPLSHLGGFPVTISPRNNKYTIDLDSKFPGQKIEIKTFKEFVGVKIIGANEDSFGNAAGITGNFKTGRTLARDGHTVLHDFNDLGLEWQVLPSDGKLFHEMASPQFPELCYLPEDPRGERARRLTESNITEEAAEAACAGLKDEFDRKGCIYDILATQDMDMAGAY